MTAMLDASAAVRETGRIRLRPAQRGELMGGVGPLAWHVYEDGTVDLVHRFTSADICDDAVVSALSCLIDIGVLKGREEFEQTAVGIIESAGTSVEESWDAFYGNTIRMLVDGTAAFAPIHRRARSLIEGRTVLEVGSCFGFLALQLAQEGKTVSACDIDPGAVALLRKAARRRGLNISVTVGDATSLPYPSNAVDTVTLVHLLEHLKEEQAVAAINEALRIARRRVVVAVPFEEFPSEHFGHRLSLTAGTLEAWSRRLPHAGAHIFTDHGGWLVLQPHGAPGHSPIPRQGVADRFGLTSSGDQPLGPQDPAPK